MFPTGAEAHAGTLQESGNTLGDLDASPIVAGMAADKEKVFRFRAELRHIQPVLPGGSLFPRAGPGVAVGMSAAQSRSQMRGNHAATHDAGAHGAHVFDDLDPTGTVRLAHAASRTGEEGDFLLKALHSHLPEALHVTDIESVAGFAGEQAPGAQVGAQPTLHAPVDGFRPHLRKVIPHFKRNDFRFH